MMKDRIVPPTTIKIPHPPVKEANVNGLKPCPFCGSNAIGVVETAYGNYENIFYFAVCDNCGSRTKSFRDGDAAEDAWNRRASDG